MATNPKTRVEKRAWEKHIVRTTLALWVGVTILAALFTIFAFLLTGPSMFAEQGLYVFLSAGTSLGLLWLFTARTNDIITLKVLLGSSSITGVVITSLHIYKNDGSIPSAILVWTIIMTGNFIASFIKYPLLRE